MVRADEPTQQEAFYDVAKRIEMLGGSPLQSPLDLLPQAVLTWSNPERSTAAGAMYLWTHEGRPQAALCVYPNEGGFDLEFKSICENLLIASLESQPVWKPTSGGLGYSPLDAERPVVSPAIRFRQIRSMARTFTADLIPPNKPAIPLRLLPAPLYRYTSTDDKSELIEGCIFAFVQGTDPEVLLFIEAIDDGSGEPQWQYALTRMSMLPTKIARMSENVWEKTSWASIRDPSEPYFVLRSQQLSIDPLE